jgi:hypothetical protein
MVDNPKIVFAHNVHSRLKTLKETILIEKKYYPDAYVSIACNDIFVNIFQEITNFSATSFGEKPHKIGCVNGCILSIKQMLNIDFDVLVFSHDDVRMNEQCLEIVQGHINDIASGRYDIICRMPEEYGDNYYMMEVFYMSKKAAVELFTNLMPLKDENLIPKDLNGSLSPEVWTYNLFTKSNLKINEIRFPLKIHSVEEGKKRQYNLVLGKNLGYHHLNAGYRGWTD